MKQCIQCGHELNDDDLYCPKCGKKQRSDEVMLSDYLPYVKEEEPEDLNEGYRVILISRGSCTIKAAKEVLSDLLGYSLATVKTLLDEVPVEIADELTETQARVLAKALDEYGMEVTVVDQYDYYVDIDDDEDSVYEEDGSLIESAYIILMSLTAANRVHRYRRYRKPGLLSLLFHPKKIRPRPTHIRRSVNRDPEPRRRMQVRRQSPYVHPSPVQTYHVPSGKPAKPDTGKYERPKQNSTWKPASKPAKKNSGSSLGSTVKKTSSNVRSSGTSKTSSLSKTVGSAGKAAASRPTANRSNARKTGTERNPGSRR